MTRILHVSDLHLGLLRYGQQAEDQVRMLDRIAAAAETAEIVVISGDVFHSRRPGSAEILAFTRFLKRLTPYNDIKTVLISAGNHDGPGEVEEITQKPTGWLAELDLPGVQALPGAGIHIIDTSEGSFGFYVLPYVHRRSRLAGDLERIIRDWPTESPMPRGIPSIFVGHLSVAGSHLSAQSTMQIGWDLTVPASVFDGYSAAMLGHIHHQQAFGSNVWYSGSPERFDFGEEDQAKGALLWEFEEFGPLLGVTTVDLGARQMRTFVLDPDERFWVDEVTPGAVLRLLVSAPAKGWETTSSTLHRLAAQAGAAWVRVERMPPERTARIRVEMDPHADVLASLRRWCELSGENYEALAETATELVR